jgi:hypothetical protein
VASSAEVLLAPPRGQAAMNGDGRLPGTMAHTHSQNVSCRGAKPAET